MAGHVSATPVPRQKAEMQLRAKMSFRLRAVIFKAITMDGCNKTAMFEHNLQVCYSVSLPLLYEHKWMYVDGNVRVWCTHFSSDKPIQKLHSCQCYLLYDIVMSG